MAEHLISIEEAETSLLSCAAFVAESIKSADGHAAAMSEIVPRYLSRNAVDSAAELANTVDDPFTRDRLLRDVAEKCAALDDDEYALQLVEAIEEPSTQDEARERIALQKAAQSDYAAAFEIAESLPHADFAFAEIAGRQAAEDEAGALKTIEKIEFSNARVAAFSNIALTNLQKNDAVKAAEWLGKAAAAAEEIEFTEEKIIAFINLGNHFLEANVKGRAIEIFDRAKTDAETLDGVQRDGFLANIAVGFLEAGSLELAERTLDLVNDNVQTATALVGYGREFWKRGEKAEAAETLEEALAILKSQRDREVRDSRARYNLWATIAVEFARFEKPERAIETAQEIPEETAQTDALKQIAQICGAQNKDDFARQAVNALADEAQKMFALLGISDAKNKADRPAEALSYLREAGSLAETVEQLSARSAAFNELAKRFYNHGDAEKMRELQYENLETIFNVRDESNRAAALAQMADFYESKNLEINRAEREMMLKIIGKTNG